MNENTDMKLTAKDESNFKNAKCCHICKKAFGAKDIKCRDHDHESGAYRGAAHQKCNVNYYSNRLLPVVVHNMRVYDSHVIVKQAF